MTKQQKVEDKSLTLDSAPEEAVESETAVEDVVESKELGEVTDGVEVKLAHFYGEFRPGDVVTLPRAQAAQLDSVGYLVREGQ